MPATLTYPGVYIEEIPSGVRTITGVATSITAFIGRALRGPTDKPVTINSYGDFERIFGGLWVESSLGYSVRDFYLNGGSQAIIVRLFTPTYDDPAAQQIDFDAERLKAKKAADAVSKEASDAAELSSANAASVATAAKTKAGQVGSDPAAKAAAGAVAKAANDAVAKAESKVPTDAAKAVAAKAAEAAEVVQDAVPTDPPAIAAANKVLLAANAVANATDPPPTAQTVAAAADAAKVKILGATPPPAVSVEDAATAVAAAANNAISTAISDANKAAAAEVAAAAADTVDAAADAAAADAAPVTKARISANGLDLEAAYEGSWGNHLRVRIDDAVTKEVAQSLGAGLTQADLFNLTVRDIKTGATEQFRNLTFVESARRADKVIENESRLIRVTSPQLPIPSAIPAANPDPATGKDIFEDSATNTASSGVTQPASDGKTLTEMDFTLNKEGNKKGLFALEQADLFNLLCIPPHLPGGDVEPGLIESASAYCEKRRAFLIVDPPSGWRSKDEARDEIGSAVGRASTNAAVFFPRLRQPNPLRNNQKEDFVPCGAVAGIFARTDTTRGVWKAPAGLDASLTGVPELSVPLTDAENGELNPKGINCLRSLPAAGRVVWGSRTRVGDDRLASEWKYIPVRRTALFIEESLYRGTQWVVFEPNDEPLWAQIRLNLGAFMHNLFRQGAFQGKTPREAYFVKCDKETTTQNDINLGIVNIIVGFAPLKPAEFVIIKLQQMAGQIET